MDDNLWRVSYSLQLVPTLITTILWLFYFKTEPVQFLLTKAEKQGPESAAFKEAR